LDRKKNTDEKKQNELEDTNMGKISPVSAKYIIHAQIQIEGVVDRSDVIGSVFGQTEGLLGADLELRELQRSGRIGRIEVELETKTGKCVGEIIIPSSLDKIETALIAASLETIQRIGPCNSQVKILNVEDVRIAKRTQVIERAKELLSQLTHMVLPDTKDVKEKVSDALRVMGVIEYGKDRLPAGPAIDESEDIILVEGRADVIALLKADIKNVIAINGTAIPESIIEICKSKTVTVFVDGDRGGDLIIKELSTMTEIDFVTKAPDGKEVEELTQKQIYKALRAKVAFAQVKLEVRNGGGNGAQRPFSPQQVPERRERQEQLRSDRPRERQERAAPIPRREYGSVQDQDRRTRVRPSTTRKLTTQENENFKRLLEDLVGTKGAYILDTNAHILGKVPTSEISSTISSLQNGVNAIVMDGAITEEIVSAAERARVHVIVGATSAVKPGNSRLQIVTSKELQ
jgi:DNA primase